MAISLDIDEGGSLDVRQVDEILRAFITHHQYQLQRQGERQYDLHIAGHDSLAVCEDLKELFYECGVTVTINSIV